MSSARSAAGIEAREAAADDLVGGVAEQPFGAGVPAGDLPLAAQHADGVVLHAVEQQTQSILGLTQLVGVDLELGVERHDAAIGFLQLLLELTERARQLCVPVAELVVRDIFRDAAQLIDVSGSRHRPGSDLRPPWETARADRGRAG